MNVRAVLQATTRPAPARQAAWVVLLELILLGLEHQSRQVVRAVRRAITSQPPVHQAVLHALLARIVDLQV